MDRFVDEKKITLRSLAVGVLVILLVGLFSAVVANVVSGYFPGRTIGFFIVALQVVLLTPLLYLFAFLPVRKLLRDYLDAIQDIEVKDRELNKQMDEVIMFKEAADASVAPVIITTAEPNNIIYVNPAWERLTGYSFKEAKGKNPRFLQSGKTPSGVYEKMWSTLISGQPFMTEEIINKRKDGTEYREQLMVSPIRKNGRTVFYVGVFQDITHRKDVERLKTEFVSLAAHQLRTPLSIINWYAETLSSHDLGKLNAAQRRYVDEIYHNSKRMGDLVSALLNASRVEMGTLAIEPVLSNVATLVDEVFSDFALQIKNKKLHIKKRYAESLPTLNVDPRLMGIVMQNLISNSVKYTPDGGSITCEISVNDSNVIIAVSDTGCGIPDKDQPKIFTKLFRADNARIKDPDGTGLGLYIMRAILEESGGRTWFISKENEGSTFFVTFPLSGMKRQEGAKMLGSSL